MLLGIRLLKRKKERKKKERKKERKRKEKKRGQPRSQEAKKNWGKARLNRVKFFFVFAINFVL